MLIIRLLMLSFVLLHYLSGNVCAAETDWSVHIRVSVPDSRGSDGTIWNHLVAGVHEGATEGFDRTWDTLSMDEADDPVQAMFTHGTLPEDKNSDGVLDNWACNNPGDGYTNQECSLWRDIRAFGEDKVWSFLVLSTVNGGTVTLEWNFEDRPADMEIVLVDLSNPSGSRDMRNSSRYDYTTDKFEAGKKYGIRYFEIRMKTKGLFITPPYLPDGTMGTFYNEKLSAVGGTPVWRLSDGALPPGMSVDPNTGDITGTPTATGLYRFTIIGDDTVSGYSRSRDYTLNINSIPEIDVDTLPDGVAGAAYSSRITITGGSAPMVWSIMGNLPEGVTLDSRTGILSGTLIVPGIYDFVAGIRDVNGATDSRKIRISVKEPDDSHPPDAISDLQGFYITDTSVLLMWSAPSDDGMTGTAALYDLRYMESCPGSAGLDEGTWDRAIEVIGEQRPQAGALQTYTLTGLDAGKTYCLAIKSVDPSWHVSPVSNVITLPLSSHSYAAGTSGLVKLISPITLRKGYNLISLPLLPVPNERESLFAASVGSHVALYRWYSAYPGLTPPQYYSEDSVLPGLGYFLYSPVDGINLFIDGVRVESPEYGMELQAGWNMVGTPYDNKILMKDISVRDTATGVEKPLIEAIRSGLIGNTLYYLKEGNYDFTSFNDDPPAAFEPWTGYWIYVNEGDGLEIVFRRPE